MRLVEPDETHLDGLHALLNAPEVVRWLHLRPSRDDVAAAIAAARAHRTTHGFGPVIALDAATGAVIGHGGVRWTTVLDPAEFEVFYAVAPDRWGRGIATHMSSAALQQAFDAGVDSVAGFTLTENARSRHLLTKLGFVEGRPFVHAGLPHVLYRLTREAHRRQPTGA